MLSSPNDESPANVEAAVIGYLYFFIFWLNGLIHNTQEALTLPISSRVHGHVIRQ